MHEKVKEIVDSNLQDIKFILERSFPAVEMNKHYIAVLKELNKIGEDLSSGEGLKFYYLKDAYNAIMQSTNISNDEFGKDFTRIGTLVTGTSTTLQSIIEDEKKEADEFIENQTNELHNYLAGLIIPYDGDGE